MAVEKSKVARALQAPAGVEDILPEDIPAWRHLEESARELCERYGYQEIRLPLLEYTSLFVRSVGEATDIVEKQMYTFKGEDEQSLSLRPELTASVVRACLEHNLFKKKPFWKLFYLGPVFRHERPQKGRMRQFHQIGVEALGSHDPLLDAETIELACRIFQAAGIGSVEVRLNSIGCASCRDPYREKLKGALGPHRSRLCENCQRRFDRNIFRIFDCKNEPCQKLAREAPRVHENVCQKCAGDFAAVEAALAAAGLPFERDFTLVRGLDYYTRTVYEFAAPGLGAQNAIGAGGRYNDLVAELGGEPTGAVGFALGIERILLAAKAASEKGHPEAPPVLAYIVSVDSSLRGKAFEILGGLRRSGISADMDYEGRSLKAQFRQADRLGARCAVIAGLEEMSRGVVKLRDMRKATETVCPLDLVNQTIQALLGESFSAKA